MRKNNLSLYQRVHHPSNHYDLLKLKIPFISKDYQIDIKNSKNKISMTPKNIYSYEIQKNIENNRKSLINSNNFLNFSSRKPKVSYKKLPKNIQLDKINSETVNNIFKKNRIKTRNDSLTYRNLKINMNIINKERVIYM